MAEKKRESPKPKPKSRTSNEKKPLQTRKQLEHEIKLQLIRYCRIWRYSVRLAIEYCKSQGHSISETEYHVLRNELKEQVLQGAMFTKQALENLQVEHGDSLELLNGMLDVVIKEIRDHSATAIYNVQEDKEGNKTYVFNKNHNSNIVAKLVTTATDLMQKRDNTILATPIITDLVNELKKGEGDE